MPHGNSKDKGSSYYRMKHSTKVNVMKAAKKMKPREAYHKLFKESGGIEGCQSVGDAPRNFKQILNMRYKLSDPIPHKDSLYEVMKKGVWKSNHVLSHSYVVYRLHLSLRMFWHQNID
jgi:hypothetical protein